MALQHFGVCLQSLTALHRWRQHRHLLRRNKLISFVQWKKIYIFPNESTFAKFETWSYVNIYITVFGERRLWSSQDWCGRVTCDDWSGLTGRQQRKRAEGTRFLHFLSRWQLQFCLVILLIYPLLVYFLSFSTGFLTDRLLWHYGISQNVRNCTCLMCAFTVTFRLSASRSDVTGEAFVGEVCNDP